MCDRTKTKTKPKTVLGSLSSNTTASDIIHVVLGLSQSDAAVVRSVVRIS